MKEKVRSPKQLDQFALSRLPEMLIPGQQDQSREFSNK